MKSEISHYLINGELFINYMDAYQYCLENNLNIDSIVKTKEY